ncbi:MAG: hypothetical protein ACKPKO_41025, partial [Candidatus Fonsibacter sp.]
MYETYNKLIKNVVDVFTLKTDAFVLRSSDLEKAYALIEFDNGFGTWRKSNYDNINVLPRKTVQKKENHDINI